MMIPLTQEYLEDLLQNKLKETPPLIMIYFTAKWCGPCNNVPLDFLVASNKEFQWFLCDVDDNQYSSGYCGVKSIPSFMGVIGGKPTQLMSSSDPNKIHAWMQSILASVHSKK